jgi:hypothetical protein
MIELYLVMKVIGLAYVITTFAPITWVIELLPDNLIKYLLVVLTGCHKCCSLWLGIVMGGIWIGVIASIIAEILTKIKQYYENKHNRKNVP